MNKKYIQGKVSVKKEGEKMLVIASDETLDRHGESIPIESWMLEPFNNAPRMLVDHDHRVEKIVGRWENVRVIGKQLIMEPLFHTLTPLAEAVEKMVKEGFLDTVSVGFIPHEVEDKTTNQIIPRNELIEVSWVTVPANPSARVLKDLEGNEVTPDQKTEIERFLVKATEIQTLVLSKEVFKEHKEATKWCTDHKFRASKTDETESSWRFRQFNPVECRDGTFGSREIDKGVTAVFCERVKSCAVASLEDFKKETDDKIYCERSFIEKLIADGEKQKTLADGKGKKTQVVASDKVLHVALKEVARIVNQSLYKAKEK